jgi:hypothetical protein
MSGRQLWATPGLLLPLNERPKALGPPSRVSADARFRSSQSPRLARLQCDDSKHDSDLDRVERVTVHGGQLRK